MARQLHALFQSRVLVLVALWVAQSLSPANACATSFDFVQANSAIVLARLHTDGTEPFDHTDVTGLSFTAEGDAVFGFGLGSYASSFDSTFADNRWTPDGDGGLKTIEASVSGIFFDDTPPPSTVLVDAQTPIFSIGLEPIASARMNFVDGTLPDFISVHGTWRLVSAAELADLDDSNSVDFADFLILSGTFGEDVDVHTEGDIDGDGTVAFADFLLLSQHFGATISPLHHVPEPSGLLMMASALSYGLLRRSRS